MNTPSGPLIRHGKEKQSTMRIQNGEANASDSREVEDNLILRRRQPQTSQWGGKRPGAGRPCANLPAWRRARFRSFLFTTGSFSNNEIQELRDWPLEAGHDVLYAILSLQLCPEKRLPYLLGLVELRCAKRITEVAPRSISAALAWEPLWVTIDNAERGIKSIGIWWDSYDIRDIKQIQRRGFSLDRHVTAMIAHQRFVEAVEQISKLYAYRAGKGLPKFIPPRPTIPPILLALEDCSAEYREALYCKCKEPARKSKHSSDNGAGDDRICHEGEAPLNIQMRQLKVSAIDTPNERVHQFAHTPNERVRKIGWRLYGKGPDPYSEFKRETSFCPPAPVLKPSRTQKVGKALCALRLPPPAVSDASSSGQRYNATPGDNASLSDRQIDDEASPPPMRYPRPRWASATSKAWIKKHCA